MWKWILKMVLAHMMIPQLNTKVLIIFFGAPGAFIHGLIHTKNKKFARFLKKWYVYAKMDVKKMVSLYRMVPQPNN